MEERHLPNLVCPKTKAQTIPFEMVYWHEGGKGVHERCPTYVGEMPEGEEEGAAGPRANI